MKILSFHQGFTRNVVLVHPLQIALKFPRFDFLRGIRALWKILHYGLCYLYFKDKAYLKKFNYDVRWVLFAHYERTTPFSISTCWFRGIMANLNEFRFYLSDRKNPLLVPTFFSLFGIFNIQPLVIPLKQYNLRIWDGCRSSTDSEDEINSFDTHSWDSGNFTQQKDGTIALYDYASSRAWPLVKKYGRRFTNILITTE